MTIQLGDFPVGVTIHIPFHTFDSDGASVTISNFAVGDILIYKDGGTTQRSSTSGYALLDTDGVDFDGVTGVHGFSIDTSDNTDAGFYAAGHEYWVVVSSVTVDTQTVNFVAATFSIERAGGALALLKHATYGLSAIEALVDDLESRLTAARAGYLDTLQYLPAATAGTAGGLFIAGTNAATTITTALTTTFTGNLTGNVGGNVTGTIGGLALAAKAEVQTEAEDALKAYDLDHLIEVTAGAEEPTDGSYLDQIMHKDASQTFDSSTDSLEALGETLDQSSITVLSTISGDTITLRRGDSFSAAITNIGALTGRTKLWFAVKDSYADTDAESIIFIEETAGLTYFNGAAASDSNKGSIVVDDELTGDVTVSLDESLTDDLALNQGLVWDIQVLISGAVSTLTEGVLDITPDVVRAIA